MEGMVGVSAWIFVCLLVGNGIMEVGFWSRGTVLRSIGSEERAKRSVEGDMGGWRWEKDVSVVNKCCSKNSIVDTPHQSWKEVMGS